jgi:hypothetical protein
MMSHLYKAIAPTAEETRAIVSDDSVYRVYIDSLVLLSDHAASAAGGEPPRLNDAERKHHIETLLGTSQNGIRANIERNLALVEQVRAEAAQPHTSQEAASVRQEAQRLVDSLGELYTTYTLLKQRLNGHIS